MQSKYFKIDGIKEQLDTQYLIDQIKSDKWFTRSSIIVNCFPEYSSRLTQSLNHGLSSMNKHELFEQIDLQMPYPSYNQVWNNTTKNYETYDTYLKNWINDNIYPCNFLFVNAGTLSGKNFNKLKLSLRSKLENENFRFASLYVEDTSIIIPDYYVHQFNREKDGGLLFEWENPLNPNWNY